MKKSPQLSLIGMAISIKTLTLHLKVSCIQMDQAQMKAQELRFMSRLTSKKMILANTSKSGTQLQILPLKRTSARQFGLVRTILCELLSPIQRSNATTSKPWMMLIK